MACDGDSCNGAMGRWGNGAILGGSGWPRWRATASRTSALSSASFIASLPHCPNASLHVESDRVDDTNDGGVHGRDLAAERLARGLAFDHDEDFLADAGADRVNGQDRRALRGALEGL